MPGRVTWLPTEAGHEKVTGLGVRLRSYHGRYGGQPELYDRFFDALLGEPPPCRVVSIRSVAVRPDALLLAAAG